jgi:GntR family transcriptional repressor for pyruvate dehydrogenase complex
MKIEKVTKNTVVRQVMDQIKTLIATGELKPGDKIPTETALSEQFGTGRSTIREAIKIFEFLGIIESHTRTGTYVCDYSNISTEALTWSILLGKNELFELVDLRSIIEKRSLKLLIETAEGDQEFLDNLITKLEFELKVMREAVQSSALDELIKADYNFHGIIINASGNNVYSHIYETLRSFMHEEIKKTNRETTARSSIVEDHQRIIEAIRDKDIAKALTVFSGHIDITIEQLS